MQQNTLINSGTDVLLALMYAAGASGKTGEPIRGFTKLEKLLFLIFKETTLAGIIQKDYHFEPDNYGPCASEIYDDIEMLKDAKIVETESTDSDNLVEDIDLVDCVQEAEEEVPTPTKTAEVFRLTEKGSRIAAMIFAALPEENRTKISLIKTLYNMKPVTEIIRYVYTKYPETTVRSRIRDEMLRA